MNKFCCSALCCVAACCGTRQMSKVWQRDGILCVRFWHSKAGMREGVHGALLGLASPVRSDSAVGAVQLEHSGASTACISLPHLGWPQCMLHWKWGVWHTQTFLLSVSLVAPDTSLTQVLWVPDWSCSPELSHCCPTAALLTQVLLLKAPGQSLKGQTELSSLNFYKAKNTSKPDLTFGLRDSYFEKHKAKNRWTMSQHYKFIKEIVFSFPGC